MEGDVPEFLVMEISLPGIVSCEVQSCIIYNYYTTFTGIALGCVCPAYYQEKRGGKLEGVDQVQHITGVFFTSRQYQTIANRKQVAYT